jgi:DNA-binding CsgD family transcriptional regulator
MEHLRQQDLRAALGFLEVIGGARDLDEFAQVLVSRLSQVIPADIVAYNEVNPALRRAFFTADLDVEAQLPGAQAILERHLDDNPLVGYHASTGDGSARTWSDFISVRQLHETALWDGLFRPFTIDRQMVATLPAPEPLLVGIVLNRSGRDFSHRDREMLDLLRPHLANAYVNAQARSAHDAVGSSEQALVILGALGDPLAVTRYAETLLTSVTGEQHLPDELLEWCRRMRSRTPLPPEALVFACDGHAVEARFLTETVVSLRRLRERVEPASLGALGLARRECEVLALVAEGLTTKEVAACIGAQPSTVKKHLERIYEKLGVTTRTAAAALAFRASAGVAP